MTAKEKADAEVAEKETNAIASAALKT